MECFYRCQLTSVAWRRPGPFTPEIYAPDFSFGHPIILKVFWINIQPNSKAIRKIDIPRYRLNNSWGTIHPRYNPRL